MYAGLCRRLLRLVDTGQSGAIGDGQDGLEACRKLLLPVRAVDVQVWWLMSSSGLQHRVDIVNNLSPELVPPPCFYQDLDEAGARACSLLLQRALKYRDEQEWAQCEAAAFQAKERAWEHLHSGPSWQSVARVHRDAYGMAGSLLALTIFLSCEATSVDRAVFILDMVALMAGERFQGVANLFIEKMQAHIARELPVEDTTLNQSTASATAVLPSSRDTASAYASTASLPSRRAGSEPSPKRAKRKQSHSGQICRIPMPTLDVFQKEYMETATPIILTGVMNGWPAMGHVNRGERDWSNLQYLRRIAGKRTVPVELGGSYTGEKWRQELMTVGDFIERFIERETSEVGPEDVDKIDGKKYVGGDGARPQENGRSVNIPHHRTRQDLHASGQQAYLAQHQLFDQIPALRRDIMTPDYCALLLPDEEDDAAAAMVATNAWYGPSGTVSPLHNDPFHNLLAQVVGCKKVLLIDRKLSASVYPRPGLMSNTSEVDAANPDLSLYPRFAEAIPPLECELRKGEMLYIPPLFWHYIESRSVSFSVSFWWGKRRQLQDRLPEERSL